MSSLSFYLLQVGFLAACAAFALWKGGRADRYGALVVLANLAIGVVDTWYFSQDEALIELCNDGLAAVILLIVTMRYAAPWMGAVMLLYAAQFSLHSFYLVTDRRPDYLHAVINNVDFTGIILCLVAGAAVAWSQRARARRLGDQAAP